MPRMESEAVPVEDRIAAMVALMRADPAVAIEAVRQVKIIGPRQTGHDWMERRPASAGEALTAYTDEADVWDIDYPGLGYVRVEPNETVSTFYARIEAMLMADGWILL